MLVTLAHAGHGAAPSDSLAHALADHGWLALVVLAVVFVVRLARNPEVK